jgi:lipid II:glycine glycyltransferase (peptidoglycan interpeptide bridge formation enzyme)
MEFAAINEDYYYDFLTHCQKISLPPVLPNNFSENIWGVVAFETNKLIGGWIGQLRGNIPFIKYFTSGVWFDSLPILFSRDDKNIKAIGLIKYAKKKAEEDEIVLLNVTHWSRQKLEDDSLFDIPSKNASFILDLKKENNLLWENIEKRLKKNIIRGQKNEIEFITVQGEEAISQLEIFQHLRKETQKRAISKNSDSSVLLKSDDYITNILRNYCSYFFIAKYKNKIVAINLMIQSGKTLYGYYGGSDKDANREVGAYSFLLWKSIEYAKEINLDFFDLGGTPINPDKNHPAYGVYFFKLSFGGEYKEFTSGKIIIKPIRYKLLNFILNNRFILRILSRKE